MDIFVQIVAKMAEYTVAPVGQWLGYSFRYSSNVAKMKKREEKLRRVRDSLQHSIDAAVRNGEEIEDDVKKWLTEVDDITELAKKVHEGEEEAKMRCSIEVCLSLKLRHQLSRKAKKIVKLVGEALENGKFDRISYRPAPQGIVTTRHMYCMEFVSRTPTVKGVKEALGDANINVIGLWGMAGVGKTTLTREIARQVKDDKLFDEVALADVTQSQDLGRIQGEIADMLDLKLDAETISGRAIRLRERLTTKEKRILVILDDIWEKLDLEKIGISPCKGCKVVLVSRKRDLLSCEMGVQKDFGIDVLPEEEAWEFFEKMAADSVKDPSLRSIATEVAKECDGLPIALATVSKALNNKDLCEWKDALQQLRCPAPEHLTRMQSTIYSCIELSFRQLDGRELKSLFLLCAQQGYDISYRDLLRYGFGLCLFRGVATLEEARNRLEVLVSKLQDACLLIQSPHSSEEFYMPDIVRHVATIIASKDEHNMFVMRGDDGQKAWPDVDELKRCEALSILGGDHIHKFPNKIECPKLRYFHVQCKNRYLKTPSSSFQGMDKLEDIFFQGMEKLEVLSLTNIQLLSLLPLANLQTLCLDGCKLGDIHWIGELKTLVILSLARSDISNLPGEIGSLTGLRLLDLTNCYRLKVIPPHVLSSLVKLEELYMRNIEVQWEVEGPNNEGKNASLAELKKLSHLTTVEIKIPDANNLPKDLFSEKLERYDICIGDISYSFYQRSAFSRSLHFKQSMSFEMDYGIEMLLKRTEYLYLDESNSTKSVFYELDREGFLQLKHLHIKNSWHLPELGTSFKYLKVLKVENCEKLRFIFSSSIARGLSLLEELKITRCNNVGAIFVKEEKDGIEEAGYMMFCRLQTLELQDLPKLVSFLSTRETNSEGNHDLQVPLLHHQLSFPSLKNLHLQHLPKIKHVWSNVNGCESLKSVTQLKSLEIGDCGVLEEIVQREDGIDPTTRLLFPSLTLLSLDRLPKLKRFFQGVRTLESSSSKELREQGGTLFGLEEVAFPTLTKLCLYRLPKIKHVWSKVIAQECLSLKQLKKIKIDECGVEEIVGTEGGEAVEMMLVFEFPQVISLYLANLPRFECFYKGVHISKWPMLKEIEICECKKVEVFASGLVSFEETVGERQSKMSIKQPLFLVNEMSFSSLEILRIYEMEKLEIIWYGQVAASPTTLHISYCGSLEAVFEQHEGQNGNALTATQRLRAMHLLSLPKLRNIWNIKDSHQRHMYSFPNLLYIDVSLCENLKSLFPTTLIAASPPPLQSLMITGCGVMEEIVAREDGTNPTRLLFPSLICLGLYGLPKLKWFFQVLHTLESSSSKELHEQGGTLFVVEEVAFPNLKLLDLYGLPKIKHVWSKDSQTIPNFQNLQVIIVGKCVSLKSLFPAPIVGCLKQLEKIKIYDCGIEEIVAAEGGEAIEMTLKEMRILECEKVKLSFPSLVTLEIRRMYRPLEIMSRNVTNRKLWRSCYARCLHANESYRLKQALVPEAMDYELLKMVDGSIVSKCIL